MLKDGQDRQGLTSKRRIIFKIVIEHDCQFNALHLGSLENFSSSLAYD